MMILPKNIKAQSTIEFTFAVVAIMFLIYGMVLIFRWAGMDLAQRRYTQDASLTKLTDNNPASELSSDPVSKVLPMAAVYHGDITNGNESQ